MKKLLTPLNILFVLFIASFSSAMALETPLDNSKEQIIADFERAKAFSLEYMEAMPADEYAYKPTDDIRSFVGQFLHIANANYALSAAITGGENPLGEANLEADESAQSKEAALKAVAESYDFVVAAISGLSEAQWTEQIKLFGAYDMSRAQAFAKTFEHGTHHRGQATLYLRMKGVTPPAEKLF